MQAQIRLQAAEMHLAALETEYCNANWAFSEKIKELREALAQRDTKHNHLQMQLAALKSSFAEHKAELNWAAIEMAQIQASESPAKKSVNCTSNPSKSKRYSPKNSAKRMFFRTAKQNSQEFALTANLTTISATSLSNRINNYRINVNPQRERITAAMRCRNSQAIMKSSPGLIQLRQTTSPNHRLIIKISPCKLSPRSAILIHPKIPDFQ